MMWKDLPTPCYVADEKKLKENLRILQKLEKDTGCHVLLAQKAFSMFSLYPMIGTFISGTTASGLYEARLGREEMGKENHVFAPAYKEADMKELVKICDHIVFNSFRQYEKYKELCKQSAQIREDGKPVSVGIRVNPECSTQEGHEIYDPCGPASRLGVTKAEFREDLLEGVEGLHFHTLCEQDADDLVITFRAFEAKFGKYLKKMKWLNLGGGHHITRPGYQLKQLKQLIAYIRATYQVEVYLEPGEAIALNAGYLVTEVQDIVKNVNRSEAILPKDILTDSVYHYDVAARTFELAENYEQWMRKTRKGPEFPAGERSVLKELEGMRRESSQKKQKEAKSPLEKNTRDRER